MSEAAATLPAMKTAPRTKPPHRRLTAGRIAHRMRRFWWRWRHLVSALAIGLAVASVVAAFRPPAPLTTEVVVAAHNLDAGLELVAADLVVTKVPIALAPKTALGDIAEVIGQVPMIAIPDGMPIYPNLLGGGDLAATAPDGTVIVPIQLDSAAAGLLRPGDHIDLLTSDAWGGMEPGVVTYLARRALVMPDAGRMAVAEGGGLLGGVSGAGNRLTLVAVSPEEAAPLSALSLGGGLAAVLVP